jgi:hypothetical protein
VVFPLLSKKLYVACPRALALIQAKPLVLIYVSVVLPRGFQSQPIESGRPLVVVAVGELRLIARGQQHGRRGIAARAGAGGGQAVHLLGGQRFGAVVRLRHAGNAVGEVVGELGRVVVVVGGLDEQILVDRGCERKAFGPSSRPAVVPWMGLRLRFGDPSLHGVCFGFRDGSQGVEEAAEIVFAEAVEQVAEDFHGFDHIVEGGGGRLAAVALAGRQSLIRQCGVAPLMYQYGETAADTARENGTKYIYSIS